MINSKLQGTKSYLRPITYDDTEIMVKWRNQDNVRRYFIYREVFTRQIHENWMKTRVETGEVVQFIICDITKDIPIGCTYLRDINSSEGTAEYGVLIGEESYRGNGIGKEVLALTLKHAFEEMKLERVNARVISSNGPSLYSFLHSGFVICEETKQCTIPDKEEVPVTMLMITREKYEESNNHTCI